MIPFLGRAAGLCGAILQSTRRPRFDVQPNSGRLLLFTTSSTRAPRVPWGMSVSSKGFRSGARNELTPLRMTSNLTKTAISTMGVKGLMEELQKRGLDAAGTRPVLQDRLRQAAGFERVRRVRSSVPPRRRRSRANHGLGGGMKSGNKIGNSVDLGCGVGTLGAAEMRASVSSRALGPAANDPSELPRATRSSAYVLQFDGGSRGNPGPSGAGAVLYRMDGDGRREEVWCTSVWVGQARTCNEAEYSALIEGLRGAKRLGIKRLSAEGDSRLVVQQMLGNYKVSSPKMLPLFKEAKSLEETFEELSMCHIERALNERADALANLAMDAGESGADTSTSQSCATAPAEARTP